MDAHERDLPTENEMCKKADKATSVLRCEEDPCSDVHDSGSYLTPICRRHSQIDIPHYEDILLDEFCGEPTYDSPQDFPAPGSAPSQRPSLPVPPEEPPPLPPCPSECLKKPSVASNGSLSSFKLELGGNGTLHKQAETQTEGTVLPPRELRCLCWSWLQDWAAAHRTLLLRLGAALGHCLVIAYLVIAVLHWQAEVDAGRLVGLSACDGLGLLLVVLGIVYAGLLYSYIISPYCNPCVRKAVVSARPLLRPILRRRVVRFSIAAVLILIVLVLLILDIGYDTQRLVSLFGLLVFLGLGFTFSKHPRQVRWQPVLTGLVLQFVMGLLTIRFPGGRQALACFAEKVASMLRCANAGATFVFGEMLVIEKSVFAFQVLPVVFFFSSLIQVLYYLGAMQWVVSRLGGLLQALMGTTVCESVNAAGSIFLGMTESPLLIRPFIEDLTRSELHAVMGTGFATASGSVLAAYISYGADPGHLLSASIMSATGALAYAKLLLPETEKSKTTARLMAGRSKTESDDTSIIDAAAKGASAAINIVLNIVANLVAFVSLLHLVNGVFSWLGTLVGAEGLSFESVLGKMFIPLVWLMGVEEKDCESVATLVGLKTVINEFVAFQRMGDLKAEGKLSERSLAVTTLVLCGFANLSSLAILMSVLSAIAPRARPIITEVAMRSLVCGVVTCCITACIGGVLMTEDSFPSYAMAVVNTTTTFNQTF